MRTFLSAIGVFVSLTAATMTSSFGSDSTEATSAPDAARLVTSPLARAFVAVPEPVYIPYAERDLAAPAPGCNWVRMPDYDSERHVIGWRGDPVEVCP